MKIIEKLKRAWAKYKNELLATINWEDVSIRAFRTFIQTAISYAVSALAGVNFSRQLGKTFWIGFLLSAGAAGLSAAWNTILLPVLNPNRTKTSLDDYMTKLAIEKAKANSDAQPAKDDTNG